MSEIMWDDPKYKMNWREIAVHDELNVRGFFGEKYRFLSNFFPCDIEYEGLYYRSSEHAYQAAKVAPKDRISFTDVSMTAAQSKNAWKGKSVYSPERWDAVKYNVMAKILFDKFLRNKNLHKKLIDTGDKYLEETLWWKDTYWGYDINLKQGENNLGKILMGVRAFSKEIQ